MLRKKLLVAFALVGLLPLAPAAQAPAQEVEVEVCKCGQLVSELVKKNKIKKSQAQSVWLECIEVMC